MSNPYDESNIKALWGVLPAITKLGAIITLIASLIFVLLPTFNSPKNSYVFESDLIRDYNYTTGPQDAKITVVYFKDMECPACAGNNDNMKSIKETYSNRVRFVEKQYPIVKLHPTARTAGQAVYAALLQSPDYYNQFVDLIFIRQQNLSVSNLKEWAKEINGLDYEKWDIDRNSTKVEEMVEFDRLDLENIELPQVGDARERKAAGSPSGTPTAIIFKDGNVVNWWSGGLSPESFGARLEVAGL